MGDTLIVLDRDGVINVDSPDYVKSAAEWLPLPGSIDAIARLYQGGCKIYVATNQAGLARGKFQLSDLDAMHAKLKGLVDQAGGHIEEIVYCPHHPDEQCPCRKPKPGMLEQIRAMHPVSIDTMRFIGDSTKDLQAAVAGGCQPVLVLTGNGKKTLAAIPAPEIEAIPVYSDLAAFADAWLASPGCQ